MSRRQPDAARYLANRGAAVGFVDAAGLGRVDAVRNLATSATVDDKKDAFTLACAYGRGSTVEFLLDDGVDVNADLRGFGEGHTALHVASYQGHAALVGLLLRRRADVNAVDRQWHVTPLEWATTGRARRRRDQTEQQYDDVTRNCGLP